MPDKIIQPVIQKNYNMTKTKNQQPLISINTKIVTEATVQHALNELVVQLKQQEKVRQHSVLHCKQWNKGCYNLLAEIILTDLSERMSDHQLLQTGSSISAKTLQKIVESNYSFTLPLDPRRINTLNKLGFFIGYKNWDDFLMNLGEEKPKTKVPTTEEQQLEETIQKALETEFTAYLNLPEIPKAFLSEIFMEGNHAFNKIMEVLLHQQGQGCIITNPYNSSTFELLECRVEKITDNYAQISTTEYWELCWWNVKTKQYLKRYKNISQHVYILNKVGGSWKIKTNASNADFLQTSQISKLELNWNQMGISESDYLSHIPLNQK